MPKQRTSRSSKDLSASALSVSVPCILSRAYTKANYNPEWMFAGHTGKAVIGNMQGKVG